MVNFKTDHISTGGYSSLRLNLVVNSNYKFNGILILGRVGFEPFDPSPLRLER